MNNYIENAFTIEGENTNLEVNNLTVGCITSSNNKFGIDSEGNITGKSLTVEDMRISTQLVLDVMYPVGSIYMSINDSNPTTMFGGVWEKIEDKFLLGSGDGFELGATGGEERHKLTAEEMPSHSHLMYLNYDQGNKTIPAWGVKYNFTQPQTSTRGLTTVPGQAGENKEHNNMPPYLVVNIWKRIN